VVGFDHETAITRNLSIVSTNTVLDLPNGQSVLLGIHESIYFQTSNHSLLSKLQLREFGIKIDSICHRHGGAQQIIMKDNDDVDALTISCLMNDTFRHRLPITKEIVPLKQNFLAQGDAPWNPSSFSDQVANKFYQQVIDTENYNASSKYLPDTTNDKENKSYSKFSFHDHLIYLQINLEMLRVIKLVRDTKAFCLKMKPKIENKIGV
jgi:hypothetical protein